MVEAMSWKPTRPHVKKRGYWANGLLCLLPAGRGFKNRLHQAATEWLDAKHGGPEKLQTFINTYLAESYEVPSEKMTEPEFLMMRREPYASGPLEPDSFVLPQKVWAISCGVDCQVNRLEVVLVGWGLGEEMWILEARSIPGNLGQAEFWQELENYILVRWKHPNGEEVPVIATGVDYGFQSSAVYRYVNTSAGMGVRAIKGSSAVLSPWVERSKDQKKPRLVICHADAGKLVLFQRLSLVEPGPGFVHFGQNLDREFFDQLTAERLVTHRSYGQLIRRFECPPGRSNHSFDALVYALAARELVRIDRKALERKYGGSEVQTAREQSGRQPTAPAAAQAQPFQIQRPRQNWG
jgi:phage terminase large subunit GpA-like protein